MSKSMKRILALLLTLALSLSFASCMGQPAETADPEPTTEDTADAPASQAEEASSEPVELSVYVPGTTEIDLEVYTEIAGYLATDYPNVTVNFTQIGWDEYFTKLNVAFSGGTAPDVYGVGLGQIGPVYASGSMMCISDELPDWDGFSDISEESLSPAMQDGKLYGYAMPEVRVLHYRTDLFEEAGLTAPPTTVEEIREYAEKLVQTDDNGNITLSGVDIGTGEQTLFSSMLMFGADKLWNDDTTSAMTEPEALEALEWCQGIMLDGISDVRLMHDVQGTLYSNGLAAMSFDGSNISVAVENLGVENMAVAPMPGDKYMLGTTCWSIYADTANKEESLAFWQAITSKEGQLLIAEKVGFVPTRESAREEYIAMNPEFNEVFFEAATKVTPYGAMNEHFFDFVNNLRPLVDEVYAGNMDPLAAMTAFEESYTEAVAAAE